MRTMIHRRHSWPQPRLFTLLLVTLSLLTACQPLQPAPSVRAYDVTVPVAWFDLSLKLVKETPGFSPPVASRAFAYLGVTLYETVRPGMAGYATLAGQLNGLDTLAQAQPLAPYHWPLAANSALAAITRQLFPTATSENLAAIDALETRFANQFAGDVKEAVISRSVSWGRTIADAIFTWSMSDGGHEGYARNFPEDYVPPTGAGFWVSTPPALAKALQPYWGQNRPFALQSADACPAPPPPAYSEEPHSEFYAQALEVYETGKARTAEHTQIALFWADTPGETATPPGHWISILNQLLTQRQATLDVAAEAYAKVGMAVADSFITCWHTKYIYNVLRPLTYIQTVIDPTWNTPEITDPVITPPFPEYTSGHSVQSSAAAAVLTELFGDNVSFTDNTHDALGYPSRSFASFLAAAEEAAVSRLYGGIHYRGAIEAGLAQGHCVAAQVLALQFRQ